ncbi:NACHT-sigma domain-containing protein [Fusarium keratoplasticum]|uniref:NACHT-sigma domain-containing protein n=1 Tax=Fusarium keratoplasticum TaxID=1328300 RepID=A0ACC0QQ76_9HYPO|nr:NACHT-sigma domain-containing protein [Fusarium keratoplasticum]KAI8663498.1 NACHT-sigma domain-containing protein [Fusarium keratoplasticum]
MERARRPRVDGLQEETEHAGPSSQGSSFNSYSSANQFNAPDGTINNSTGPGNHLTGSTFNGPVYFGTKEHFDPLQECGRSLAFPEIDSRSNDIDAAAKGTCEWLLLHKTYKSWTSCDRGLLWIKGKPGSGKSTLLRYVLNNVMAIPNIRESALILSFFFHGRGTELQRTPFGLFRSLLHQFLRYVPEALTDFVAAFQQRCETVGKPGEKWQWHPHELQRRFESSLLNVLKTRPLWLFVDALDECGEENARKLVKEFKSLLETAPSIELKKFRICFTCRHYPILALDGVFEIWVEKENSKDISTFVQAELSSFRERTSSTIPDLIMKRANGVFLWARLVVKRILDLELEGAGLKQIEAVILSVPQELDALYRQLIQSMSPDSLKLIQWICFATRPLSLEELRWAMLVEADCPHRSLFECQNAGDYPSDDDRMKRRVQTLSCGLAEVTSPVHQGLFRREGSIGSGRIQFIHQSVKDFFVEKGLSALDGSLSIRPSTAIWLVTAVFLHYFPRRLLSSHAFHFPIVFAISAFWRHGVLAGTAKPDVVVGIAHHRLSKICLRYLAMEEISRLASHKRDSIISEFPFLHYATASWVAHTKQSHVRGVLQEDLLECFTWPSNTLMERWVCVYRILEQYSRDCPLEGTSLVHVMSRYGVAGALWAILKRADQVGINIDARDSDGRTPLSWAAEGGHEAVVRLLLDRGAHTEVPDKESRTPLWRAAEKGHEAVVRLLLDRGAHTEVPDKESRTPLWRAAEKGHEAVARLLLDRGAHTEAADKGGWTPLLWAAAMGRRAVVRLLLDRGAHLEAADLEGRTPLLWAAEKGHEAVVRLLLDRDAHAEAAEMDGRTPLWWAAAGGHEAIVRLLLDRSAHTEAADLKGQTPLLWAAEKGHEAVARLLLDRDAHTEAADVDGRTPLWWAAAGGHEAVVQLLLDRGAHTEAADKGGWTPLLWAAAMGRRAVVRLLLDRGAHIEAADKGGRTTLLWAAENGHEAVVRLLLDRGA